MSSVTELIVAALIIVGAAFTALGSFGLLRLRDFYSRLHSPTKATTLGVGGVLLAERGYEQVADRLAEEDFYREDHRLIFRRVTDIHGYVGR